jgi:spermidine synthase
MPKRSPASPIDVRPASTAWLGALVFLTGGVILVLEIVGARLISPMYGSSLYVWSSLITVTLLSLAVGYETGGRLADRYDTHRTLQWLLAVAGVAILLVPALRAPVLSASTHLGMQAGTLAAAAGLLLVPLVLLSAAGIVVARAATRSLEGLGRGVGRISFYSTLGSVAGALLTGFFLIPRFAVSHIFYGAGAAVLAGLGLVALDRRRPAAAAVVIAVAVAAGALPIAQPEPARADVLLKAETFYGELTVLESRPYRFLLLDGIHQSLWSADTQENSGQYIRGLELAALASGGNRALVIGIGAGTLPVILERYYGMVADAVDVNAKVVDVARQFFAFQTKGTTAVEDGRTFVRRCPAAAYDLVVLDTFSGDAVPYHLLTREFFTELRRILRPAGILAVNTVGLIHGRTNASPDVRAVAATLATAFPERRAFALLGAEELAKDPGLGNVLLFASAQPIAPRAGVPWRPSIRETVATLLEHEIPASGLAGGLCLTDDYNPIDLLYAETAREWRRRTIEWSRTS